jgi:hypothetical protein
MNRANFYDPLPLESEPVRKADAPGTDQSAEKRAADPLPLGLFVKMKKEYRVGDQFKTATGELARVTEVTGGKVSFEFKGGSGVLLNI